MGTLEVGEKQLTEREKKKEKKFIWYDTTNGIKSCNIVLQTRFAGEKRHFKSSDTFKQL